MKILIYILIIVGWAVKSYIDAKQKNKTKQINNPPEKKDSDNKGYENKQEQIFQTVAKSKFPHEAQQIVVNEKKKSAIKKKREQILVNKEAGFEEMFSNPSLQNEEEVLLEEETVDFDLKKAMIYSEIIKAKYV